MEPYRVFIDLGTPVCPAGCRYCYVPAGRSSAFSASDISSGLSKLVNRDGFRTGRSGTIVTFGGHTDLFLNPELVDRFLRALTITAGWGNPVQVSTKQTISRATSDAMHSRVPNPGQLCVFVSCASISWAREIEPCSPPPSQRFRSFQHLAEAGLPACLLIKPWLGRRTAVDSSRFSQAIRDHRIPAVCVGAFYVSDSIRARYGVTLDAGEFVDGRHPLLSDAHIGIQPSSADLRDFSRPFEGVGLFRSSLCVTAHFAGRPCPLHGAACRSLAPVPPTP